MGFDDRPLNTECSRSSVALIYLAGFSLVILVVFVSPGSDENGYPSEGIAFMGYSLIFVMILF